MAVTTVPAPAPPAAETVEIPVAPAEVRALAAVQRRIGQGPVVATARGMSLFGEHAAGWLALGLLGALADRPRRRDWLTATAGVAAAHGASIAVKRVVRRPRPTHPRVQVLVGTPSRLSFPSAHATSTTAAAVLYGGLLGRRLAPVLVPPDGAVPAGPGRALPDRRRRGRPAGRRSSPSPRDAPAPRKVPAMTDIEVPPAPVAPARTPLGVARGVLRTMRPRQWVKNVLVSPRRSPAAICSPRASSPELLVAFVAFSLAASGIYLVNDANDVDADRAHPTKRLRPIAAGIVPRPARVRGRRGAARRGGGARACSRPGAAGGRGRPCTSWCSSPTASGSSTSRCSTSASSPSGFLLRAVAGGAATGIRCRSGSCSSPASARCSWWPASATPRCMLAERGRREDPQVAGELHGQPTCGSCGRCRRRC